MLVSKHFIFLNFPKTGSSFVRKTLKDLNSDLSLYDKFFLNRRIKEVLLPSVRIKNKNYSQKDAHIICYQLTEDQKRKDIFSVIRNPVHRMVSYYEYGFWKNVDELPIPFEKLKEFYPEFPNISFSDYLHLMNSKEVLTGLFPSINFSECKFGFQSLFFLLFFLKDPFRFFEIGDFSLKNISENLVKVNFLYSEELNANLFDVLLNYGYQKRKIEFIRHANKVNESVGSKTSIVHRTNWHLILQNTEN
jgi:hypothetical protein